MTTAIKEINIGIPTAQREAVAHGLAKLLADSYTLYLTTHNFHWNITGPMFQPLHQVFEEHYLELAEAVDTVAERIRALGFPAPATYREFSQLTRIKEPEGVPEAKAMIRHLVEAHESVVRTAREILPSAQEANDEVTIGLLTDRMTIHEKTAWMLRSFEA